MTGLTWLADLPGVGSWPFCLTFVRGGTEREVIEGFGADPEDTVAARATIPFGEVHERPRVMVGRSGEWVFALEENITAQGTRPEVLRRLSARTEAVAVYNDIGKGNDEFAHAFNGEVITALTTSVPPHWRGSEPDRLRSLAEEIALDDDGESGLLGLAELLALAEGVFGISLGEEDLRRPLVAAPVLPVLDDLPAPRPTQARPRVSDPVISLLLAHPVRHGRRTARRRPAHGGAQRREGRRHAAFCPGGTDLRRADDGLLPASDNTGTRLAGAVRRGLRRSRHPGE